MIYLCEHPRRPDVLHRLAEGPLPHAHGAVLAARNVCNKKKSPEIVPGSRSSILGENIGSKQEATSTYRAAGGSARRACGRRRRGGA